LEILNAGRNPSSGLSPAGFCNDVANKVDKGNRKNKNNQTTPGRIKR
jgi:hypothetical protein